MANTDEALRGIRDALAVYFDKDPSQVGALLMACESVDQEAGTSATHTVYTITNYMHMMGMLAELKYQITQNRQTNEARTQIEALMSGDDGQV